MVVRLQRVAREATVLRLRPQRAAFPEQPPVSQWDDFDPSTDEKEDAERTGDPVLVSVWNEEQTSLEQARALYGRPTAIAFRLKVADLEDVEVPAGKPPVTVLTDPYVDDPRPGAVGHCGITGLEHRKGEPRPARRDFLGRVAKCAIAC